MANIVLIHDNEGWEILINIQDISWVRHVAGHGFLKTEKQNEGTSIFIEFISQKEGITLEYDSVEESQKQLNILQRARRNKNG